MSLFEALVLGLVQGLTEFLPISSTAHLRIVPALVGWDDPGVAFTAVTQLGTVVAVLLYFRHDLWAVATGFTAGLRRREARGSADYRMGWYLVVGTVPLGVFGLAFHEQVGTTARDLTVIATTLILLAVVLLVAERVGSRTRGLEDVRMRDAVVVGLAQATALVPGVSRAGATLTAGLFLGMQRDVAARFSFLLAVPAIVLSGLWEVRDAVDADDGVGLAPTLLATAVAFVAAYVTIEALLRFLATHSTTVFIVYRVLLGLLLFGLLGAGLIE